MSQDHGLSRRTFIKSTGMATFAGTVGVNRSFTETVTTPKLLERHVKHNFDEVYDRVGTDSVKWDEQINMYGKNNIAVPMGVADMDFRIAPAINKALRTRIKHENYGYLSMPPSYVESIVNWNKRRNGIDINRDLLLHASGVHSAILSALRAFCPPGSKVILQSPTYSAFYRDLKIAGCKKEENRLKLVNGQYVMDFEDLERRIDRDTHAIILCNPQNPTGNVWSREDLTTLGEICTKHRVVILSDEIHCDFVTKGNTHTPFASLSDEGIVRNSITFNSASKSFNLAAMRCAYMFSTNPDYIARIKESGHWEPLNTLGIVAGQAAYEEAEEWLQQVIAYIDGTMDYVERFIGSNIPLINFVKPQGTYLAWLDVNSVIGKIGAKEIATKANTGRDPLIPSITPEMIVERYFVEHAKVQINAGSPYGYGSAGWMRVNLATSRTLVKLALNNMAEALEST